MATVKASDKQREQRDDARRIELLDAAAAVFLRYGYKKTSMDDVATAAGLSRQALYLRFSNKDDLFRAAVERVLERALVDARAALHDTAVRDLEERIVNAYAKLHGAHLGDAVGAQVMAELIEVATALMGPNAHAAGDPFIDDVARIVGAHRVRGVSARDIAATIDAASRGIKHSVTSLGEYRREMTRVVRVVLRGGGSR